MIFWSSTFCPTYVNFNFCVRIERFAGWMLKGCVAIELVAATIPFDAVNLYVVRLIIAIKLSTVSSTNNFWIHRQAEIRQTFVGIWKTREEKRESSIQFAIFSKVFNRAKLRNVDRREPQQPSKEFADTFSHWNFVSEFAIKLSSILEARNFLQMPKWEWERAYIVRQ